MFGFAGAIATENSDLRNSVSRMIAVLKHRGPDGSAQYDDEGVSLGHARLTIRDFTDAGCQPKVSANGRYVLIFNGEIYNTQFLKQYVEQINPNANWAGTGDTEVLLEFLAVESSPQALDKIEGMFAFALWDRFQQEILLARDKFGEKPLYYSWDGKNLVFGSELKAVLAGNLVDARVNLSSVADYFRFGHVVQPATIYENIFQVRSGCYIKKRRRWSI